MTEFEKFIESMSKHCVAGSTRLKATTTGHIFDIRASVDLDNGTLVARDALETGQESSGQVYTMKAPTGFAGKVISKAANGAYYVGVVTPGDALFVLTVPHKYADYTTALKADSTYYNGEDEVMRAYELYTGDVFEVSAEGFVDEFAVGDAVVVDATTYKLKKSA